MIAEWALWLLFAVCVSVVVWSCRVHFGRWPWEK